MARAADEIARGFYFLEILKQVPRFHFQIAID
jgi:hypothetical protein